MLGYLTVAAKCTPNIWDYCLELSNLPGTSYSLKSFQCMSTAANPKRVMALG